MKKIIFKFIALLGICSLGFAEKITAAVNPGEAFKNRAPQVALWIEDSDGNYTGTLFVTRKASENKWIFAPKNGRPEALPDWYTAKGQNPAEKISREKTDAETSATPKKGLIVSKEVQLEKGKKYFIKCQVNQSFDYNDFYTKENSGVDGQPAILYKGEIISDGEEKEIKLERSDSAGNITTADKILESIFVEIK